jgi:nucleotide-binding universal stress UspA family protein
MKGLLENLLVVVNGSDASIAAAKYAAALGKTTGAKVTAAYVVDTATIRQLAISRIFIAEEGEEYERSLEDTGKRYLNYVEEIGRSKRVAIAIRLLKGSVADEIVKLAAELGVDCILLGGWERDSSFRDVIREANAEITKLSPCSVLVVKSHDAEIVFKAL